MIGKVTVNNEQLQKGQKEPESDGNRLSGPCREATFVAFANFPCMQDKNEYWLTMLGFRSPIYFEAIFYDITLQKLISSSLALVLADTLLRSRQHN